MSQNVKEVDLTSPTNIIETNNSSKECHLLELLATNSFITNLLTFKGDRDEDIHYYFRLFEDQTYGLEDRMKILGIRRSFVGAARDWLVENCRDLLERGNYHELKKKIKERYSRESASLNNKSKLNSMRFDPSGNEPLASFIDRYVAQARKSNLGNNNDREILTGILLALPDDVQGELEYLDNLAKVSDVNGLRSIAHRYDSIVSKRNKCANENSRLAALVSSIDTLKEEFRHTLATIASRDNVVTQRSSSRSNQVDIKCYNCQKNGHIARKCPEPRVERTSRDERKSNRKDYSSENQQAVEEYEKKFGKPEVNCAICNGYHFVYHCPLRNLKD